MKQVIADALCTTPANVVQAIHSVAVKRLPQELRMPSLPVTLSDEATPIEKIRHDVILQECV